MNKKDVERLEGEVRDLRRQLGAAESRMEGLEARARKAEHTVAEYEQGLADVNLTVDAVMAETARSYGVAVLHDDGSLKGYHLQLGKFDPREVMRQWMVTASRREDGGMLIGVQERDQRRAK